MDPKDPQPAMSNRGQRRHRPSGFTIRIQQAKMEEKKTQAFGDFVQNPADHREYYFGGPVKMNVSKRGRKIGDSVWARFLKCM